MFLKIIWENAGETIVDCARVRVAPLAEDGANEATVMFEALDHDDRPQGNYHVSPKADIQVFLMNEKGATIENWHSARRASLLKWIADPLGPPDYPPYSPAKKNPLIDPMAAVERYKEKGAAGLLDTGGHAE